MADYNVQMKQYNGTSFDNILPYASQALTLAGGGGATEIIAKARVGLSQIATGGYVGTGTYGASNPTVITCGFKPKVVLFIGPEVKTSDNQGYMFGLTFVGWFEGATEVPVSSGSSAILHFTPTGAGLSFYVDGSNSSPIFQNNANGGTYKWVALG